MNKGSVTIISIVFLIGSFVLYQWQQSEFEKRYSQIETEAEEKEAEEEIKVESITPVLRSAIDDFDSSFSDKPEILYTVEFEKENDKSFMILSANPYIDLNALQGYTYVDGHLFTYYGNKANVEQSVLNVNSLNKGRGLLDTYKTAEDATSQYEVIRRKYELVTPDSLLVISTKKEIIKKDIQ